jgi:uncharacterized repeat protein (TIGR02543 family)
MKKKVLSIVTIFLVAVVSLFSLTGCDLFYKVISKILQIPEPLPEYESGYWRYAVETAQDGTQKAYLIGFTELGQEQSTLIVPEEIDGIKTCNFGFVDPSVFAYYPVGDFQSEKLERLYVPFGANWGFAEGTYKLPNCSVVEWYYNKDNFYYIILPNYILGYNVFKEYQYQIGNSLLILANISYLYNYEDAPNDDYYWVDSYDNSTVKYIPPEPTREGYTFGGWYKEAECINAWDFEVDKTGEEIAIRIYSYANEYDSTGITFLYAKWS